MTIYTVNKIIAKGQEPWAVVLVSCDDGASLKVAAVWPDEYPISGQRFKGDLSGTGQRMKLENVRAHNVDENALRGLMHAEQIPRKVADTILRGGMKRLLATIADGRLARFKGVGPATQEKILVAHENFCTKFAFRQAWFEAYPALEAAFDARFDTIMRESRPDAWKDPFLHMIRSSRFWGMTMENEDMNLRRRFAQVVAKDCAETVWKSRFLDADNLLRELRKTGSTIMNGTCATYEGSPITAREARRSLVVYEQSEFRIAQRLHEITAGAAFEPKGAYRALRATDAFRQLDDVQWSAVEAAMTRSVTILCGGAGVGKSATLKAIVSAAYEENLMPLVCAPTGKAAIRLQDDGVDASTVHSAFFKRKFADAKKQIRPVDMLILDEQSMQELAVLANLLRILPDLKRVVFVGDPFQLPSVGPGALLRDLIRSKVFHTTRLERIYRQNGGSIVRNANRIRRGNAQLETDAHFQIHPYGLAAVVNAYVRADNAVVLAATNKMVQAINKAVHARLRPASSVFKATMNGAYKQWPFFLGDRVLSCKKIRHEDTKAVLAVNGSIGAVVATTAASMTVEYPDGPVEYKRRDVFGTLLPTYALTVHRSQGSEYDQVICVTQNAFNFHRQLLYTAVTRAKTTCVIFDADRGLAAAIRRRASERQTTLQGYVNTCFSPTTTQSVPSFPRPMSPPGTPTASPSPSAPTSPISSPRVAPLIPGARSSSPAPTNGFATSAGSLSVLFGARPTAPRLSSPRPPCASPTSSGRSSTKRSMASRDTTMEPPTQRRRIIAS